MGEKGLTSGARMDGGETVLAAALPRAFRLAFDAATEMEGATAPNPPVGCALLDAEGRVLTVAAHVGAGKPHAEAAAIALARETGVADRIDTVVVTLEPCNHTGRTPPCVQAILSTPARRVLIGAADPNPVASGGAEALRAAGLRVEFLDGPMAAASRRLIAPFAKRLRAGLPWVTVKRAFDAEGSMIPPPGAKTFTTPASLLLAHALRRRADALMTGVDTIIADKPLFSVRRLPDHPGKRRALVVMDRLGRLPADYALAAAGRGLDVRRESDLEPALRRLAEEGVMEVMVEAGPRLSGVVLESDLWDESIVIRSVEGARDRVSRSYRAGEPAWEEADVLRHR